MEERIEKVIEILSEVKPGVDFENEKSIIDDKLLDSMSIVILVSNLNDEFDIEITPVDIVPENFQSAEAIAALVERLEEE